MFSCCACTRPSKLDTEEVRSDDTSDSDEEDDSLEEDEKSENGDAQNSDDEKPNKNNDEKPNKNNDEKPNKNKEEITTEKVESEIHSLPSPVTENRTHSPQKTSISSPQKSSTSTEVLSEKTSVKNEVSSPTKIKDSEVLQKSSFEEKVPSPGWSQTEVEPNEVPSSQKAPTFESEDSRKIEDQAPSPEKSDSSEEDGPSPETTLNTGSVVNLPGSVDQLADSEKLESQLLSREKSQSFEDEDLSPESTSNTGSVVHIPSSVTVNEVTSSEKISTVKNEVPSPENVVSRPENVSSPLKSGSFEDEVPTPENTSITGFIIQIPAVITDNEVQKVPSPPKSPPPENQILLPPPESEDFSLPPEIEGFILPTESGEIVPPPDSGEILPPPDSGEIIPPPDSGEIIPPPDSGEIIPPSDSGEIIPPPDSGDFISPPESGDFVPPPKTGDIISPPESGDFILPPETEDIILPPESGYFILPPENEDFHSAPESGSFIPPQRTEDLIPPQEYDDLIPPPENEAFLPPPENEVTTPSPENMGSSSQKSPTFDSEVPSPQNTWTSSSTDDEKRAIDITEFIGIVGNVRREKSPLHHAPAYIERTVDDGPEEEGDDSVFESYPTPPPPEIDLDASKKTPTVPPPIPQWLSQEDEDENISEGYGGMQEPPATPVARDEVALRRHRFFSDLLQATRNSAEHRVSFDPLGPTVHSGCEADDREEHLEELVTRLENVTRRLERVPAQGTPETQEIAVQTKTPSPEKSPSPKKSSKDSISSEDQCSQGSSTSISSAASSIVEINNMSVAGYEDLVAGPVREYLELSRKIGGDVASHSQLVERAFQIQLAFIKTASSRPAPANQTEQVSLLGPTSSQIQQIQEFRNSHRASPFFNHLSAISESIPALGWVAVSPTPAPYVKEMNDAGQFYTNRVLKDWKEKDKTHVEWCKAWVQTLSELQQYVRKNHTTGLVWAKGGTIPPPPAGVPPPPPPSMPLGEVAPAVNDDRSALFAEINQGENITRNLKKVTSEMQTHKNPNLRTGPAPFKAPASTNSGSPMKNTLLANAPIDKPPVFTRDGKKWLVEYQKGNKNLLIEDAEMNNVIYMYRCQDSTLVIKGKVNSVVMDSCRKSSIVFDSLVSSIEFVNCQSVQMQVLGKVPTISIDKTDGCQMYLNSETLQVELISSKSSEMNVMVPKGNGDYTEFPVPEQFKTTVSPKGLNTIAIDSLG